MPKDDMNKSEGQEMKKIRPMKRNLFDKIIKQNVIRSKPKINRDKIVRDKLKDQIIRVFRHFLKQKKKI